MAEKLLTTAKVQRKPCQTPNSARVHAYRPPAAGYFTASLATAMASGTTKNIAVTSQRVMEPGPAWAAAAIQRVPTMQAMAKSATSRRPSSRFSSPWNITDRSLES